jgi:hypothetical protein
VGDSRGSGLWLTVVSERVRQRWVTAGGSGLWLSVVSERVRQR